MHHDDKYYRLQNFYEAAFLFASGMELANVDRITDSKRATFVFVNTPERESLTKAFGYGKENSPETLVDARKLITAIRALKEKLYQENF